MVDVALLVAEFHVLEEQLAILAGALLAEEAVTA